MGLEVAYEARLSENPEECSETDELVIGTFVKVGLSDGVSLLSGLLDGVVS